MPRNCPVLGSSFAYHSGKHFPLFREIKVDLLSIEREKLFLPGGHRLSRKCAQKRIYCMKGLFTFGPQVWNPHCYSRDVNPGSFMTSSAATHGVKRQSRPFAPIEMQIQRAIARIAESDCPVLIVGEHGVGKRSIAEQIHAQSHRTHSAYTEIHSIDADAQAILSAFSTRGTLYLAEIGDLSLALQELIVNNYFRSGQQQSSRLLCGTSRELLGEVKTWRMREDFYYLVSAVSLRISPLRCRKSEILSIADDLLTQYARQFDRPKPVLREEIIGFLMEHTWPENLFELQTAIKTFVAIGDQSISLAALKAAAPTMKSNGFRKPPSLKQATRAASTQIERQLISEVLVATGGNRKRAADELGISYKALLYKLKQAEAENQSAPNGNGVAP
jgi:two-component system response regulator AtoC